MKNIDPKQTQNNNQTKHQKLKYRAYKSALYEQSEQPQYIEYCEQNILSKYVQNIQSLKTIQKDKNEKINSNKYNNIANLIKKYTLNQFHQLNEYFLQFITQILNSTTITENFLLNPSQKYLKKCKTVLESIKQHITQQNQQELLKYQIQEISFQIKKKKSVMLNDNLSDALSNDSFAQIKNYKNYLSNHNTTFTPRNKQQKQRTIQQLTNIKADIILTPNQLRQKYRIGMNKAKIMKKIRKNTPNINFNLNLY